ISSPRFSKQKTCSTSGSVDSSVVRSAHTSTSIATRSGDNCANEVVWSEVKQTTSHRPRPARRVNSSPAGRPGGRPSGSGASVENDGDRFSKSTSSYDAAGISLGWHGRDGWSGHWSVGGRNERVCRCAATATHTSNY